MLYFTTFGYGTQTKQFLAGSRRGAFLVFDNIHIWPVTSLLFIPFIFGLGILIYKVIIHWRSGNDLFKRDIFLLISLVPLFYIIFRGIISARFHLLYFVPFVIISSLGIFKVFSFLKEGKNRILSFVFLLSLGVYGSYVSSWENWYYGIFNWGHFYKTLSIIFILIAILFFIEIFRKINRKIFAVGLVGIFLLLLTGISFLFGPLVWGINAAWAPAFDNKLNYLEGDEETVINFAVAKNKPAICNKLPIEYQERCLDCFK
jgi:MFS family permease